MSRIPPSLLYLTIYNPTLRPSNPVSPDDEDAEEQAHVLFYTARERAASRDRILRQVGLAKALVNFAGMFNEDNDCENIHSQSRRMIMVSPEPNFWIHACVELAKTPRQPKRKSSTKGKGKDPPPVQEAAYEYHDGSVHDAAIRQQVIFGYEQFKLTHGSFTSILSSIGQQALELQLERFFTVWAWKWDFEEGVDFGEHLGPPLHQAYRETVPLLDNFAAQHLSNRTTFILRPPYLLPSSNLLQPVYPSALSKYIQTRIPPPPPSPPSPSPPPDAEFQEGKQQSEVMAEQSEKRKSDSSKAMANALANMDPRNLKWMWTGLTFGKGLSPKPTIPPTPAVPSINVPDSAAPLAQGLAEPVGHEREVEIDTESLQEAMASENIHISAMSSPAGSSPVPLHPMSEDRSEPLEKEKIAPADALKESQAPLENDLTGHLKTQLAHPVDAYFPPPDETVSATEAQKDVHVKPVSTPPADPPPVFLSTSVFLADPKTPEQTTRHKAFHATKGGNTFAFIATEEHDVDLETLGAQVVKLFDEIDKTLQDAQDRETEGSVLTVTKILEPQDKHILSFGSYTISSLPTFSSTSEHLFNARDVLHSDIDATEVFSRGQNPQHWHVGRRGLDTGDGEGEVYMEVARKETTLTDVDNGLANAVKRWIEQ